MTKTKCNFVFIYVLNWKLQKFLMIDGGWSSFYNDYTEGAHEKSLSDLLK